MDDEIIAGSSKDVNEAPKTTRNGPYKLYVYCESESEVRTRTKRYWKAKQKITSDEDSPYAKKSKENPDGENDSQTGRTEDTRVSSIGSGDIQNDDRLIDATFANRSPPFSDTHTISDNRNSPNEVYAAEIPEKYSKDFLIQTLLILATKLRHNLTYKAAEDIMKLTCVMSDTPITDSTKYYWKKIINDFSNCLTEHCICDTCGSYIGVVHTDESSIHCSNCEKVVDCPELKNVFLYISLAHQLKEIFELTDAHENFRNTRVKECDAAFEDIFDGTLYKTEFGEDMISINFSFDGVPVFPSSNSSMHPVLATINELHPLQRKKYVLLCSVWFGKGKPNANEYLKPFVAEAKKLYTEGFEYQYGGIQYRKKCRVLTGISDSIARPMLRNCTQFNGEYGCGLCLHSGEMIKKGRGSTRVYPLGLNDNAFGEGLRTHEQTLQHAEEKTKGIQGRSVLCDIPGFNIITSLDLDWMHAVSLGVCRQFAKLWFNSQYHSEEFYFGHCNERIDSLLVSFTPTVDVSRTPRKMSDRANWKSHEWVIFLWFYSLPILHAVFSRKYVKHWALLVDALQILCKKSIMKSEIIYSHRLLIEFIRDVEELYGRKHVSFNVHLLAHLAKSVENLGPLWTHSAFVYEDTNQTLLNYIKSSNGVKDQVCDAFRSKCVVDRLRFLCSGEMKNTQKRYLNDILGKKVKPSPTLILEHVAMIGLGMFHRVLPRVKILAFVRANVVINEHTNIESYKRVIINGEIVHSSEYSRMEKRANYYVRLFDGEIFEIQSFYVLKADRATCYALGIYFEKTNKPFINDRRLNNLIVLNKRSEDLAVVHVAKIKEKVTMLYVQHLQVWVACIHPNRYELLT